MTTTPQETGTIAAARAWAAQDPDPATCALLLELIDAAVHDAAAAAELADAFAGNLAFGTAGLRAALGPGPNRMNRMVVRRTAAGIARFLNATAAGDYVPTAVVGYDARHNSDVFAAESAAIFTAAGVRTLLLPAALPTPVLAWAVRAFGAESGVMVTASHNPPADNGYKVYLGGRAISDAGQGAQIVAPTDAAIAALIDHDEPICEIALAGSGWSVLPGSGQDGDIEARYIAAVAAVAGNPQQESAARASLDIVLTPLHGVGGHTMASALAQTGFASVAPVPEQWEPDPEFPTVDFPNPEEPGALDLALALAAARGADLVIANDPDADRCAAAVDFPGTGWRMLRGDELGALLGEEIARNRNPGDGTLFANSIVSSRQLASIAAAHGIGHRATLTGFKWIARVPGLAFGYEEALGYCVAPELVRDKDGISAGLLLARLAARLKAAGSSIPDALDRLSLAHGLHTTDQLSVRVADLDLIGSMMAALRTAPPAMLAGSPVTGFADLAPGGDLPPTDALVFETADRTRAIVRPSGTEPKLKCYLETIDDVADASALPAARAAAARRLTALRADLSAALGLPTT
ncbi:phospho-sugar mutase [Paeniglutamicibacter cryotolerans]|uniref:Phosphomannomutase n=1 Tax=Paeniglutamicibacter cryotolerans TaxID=670079 RepID=A0A839QVI1_9MICC|nr:phospho-sugar mutase [Paeniglutamicibacter cryotolerans]MBB2996011.1 phosphomannomutase [Paeniglutamicibacter cryotolerans]